MSVRALPPYAAKRFWVYLNNRIQERKHQLQNEGSTSTRIRLMLDLEVYQRVLDAFSACFRGPICSKDDVRPMGGRQTAAFLRSMDADIASLRSYLEQNEHLRERPLAEADQIHSPDAARSYQEILDRLTYQLSIFESMRIKFRKGCT